MHLIGTFGETHTHTHARTQKDMGNGEICT